jgi:uncharacterized membrane protein
MTLLILGLALWVAVHMFKRLAPGARDALTERIGAGASKGVVAVALVVALVLIVIGFRAAPFVPLYSPPVWGVHVNNLAMLAAVALFGMGQSRGRARSWLRHPMLTGVVVWALAHLLVNGDLASVLLFGTMGAWAVAHMGLINLREPAWERPEPGPVSGDVRLAVITVVVYVVIALIHGWLGYWPFPQ